MRAAFRALASPTWGSGFLVVDPGEVAPWPGWQGVASLQLVVPPPTHRQRSSPHIISTPMLPQNPDSPARRELLPRTGRLDLSYLLELQTHRPPQRLAVRALLPPARRQWASLSAGESTCSSFLPPGAGSSLGAGPQGAPPFCLCLPVHPLQDSLTATCDHSSCFLLLFSSPAYLPCSWFLFVPICLCAPAFNFPCSFCF